jgi:hypothetical protein
MKEAVDLLELKEVPTERIERALDRAKSLSRRDMVFFQYDLFEKGKDAEVKSNSYTIEELEAELQRRKITKAIEWCPEVLKRDKSLIVEVTETTIHHDTAPYCCGCLNGYKILTRTSPKISFVWEFVCNECGQAVATGSSRNV